MFGVLTVASIVLAFHAQAQSLRGRQAFLFSNHFGVASENATYDYVVIGGGTAGLALATRLAENESISVAVIEAGDFYEKDHGNRSIVPGYGFGADASTAPSLLHSAPLVDWAFLTVPQTAMGNQTYHYPRGRCLGGTSARNAMLYQRGSAGSYNQWATQVGDNSYNFSSLFPFFKKSTHYTSPDIHFRAANASVPDPHPKAFSATGGPLEVSIPRYAMPFSSWALPALKEAGLPELEDMNSGNLLGGQYSAFTVTPEDATRSSSESSFLQESFASTRTNLKIYPQTMAKQILFDKNKSAIGVRVNSYGAEYILSANKEVILSGGTFSSPQILMVSGVGPKQVLEKYDIPVLADRPGDHMLIAVVHEIQVPTQSKLSDPVYKHQAEQEYIQNATGMLTNVGADMLGFEKLPRPDRANLSHSAQEALSMFAPDWPEIEYVISSLGYAGAMPGKDYGTIYAGMVAPLSRGSVTTVSNDSSVHPLINPGWFSNSTDLEVAVQAFKRTRAIWKTKALAGVVVGDELAPGSAVQTDAEIAAYILKSATTIYHPACTCKMGKLSDPMTVVDSRARVIGVKNLRVVDASAFPLLPPGHPQSTVYALAEKIAADILEGL
ncbi:hypothetical protein BP5796_12080 [Coleophoma crateriformis]|uniref:Glucose-methanol-choline oxidoreductase N-terminal domain-containing protein n=1 Tax=Coleophoma crateriformis TaxID=565419 RepID=A0A3D8QBD3_9HELO|nr:hypothetical protein BP5796_12080 [Coleophoma crateriformis]